MVEVKYNGGLGNKLFQYCFGRIIAEKLGFQLKADPIPGFPNTAIEVKGHDYSSYTENILLGEETDWRKRQKVDLKSVLADKSKRKIIIDGFFQRYEYYKDYKEEIKNNWLKVDYAQKDWIGADDVVLHIRRGDIIPEFNALPFSYYEEALERCGKFDKIYICTDDTEDHFLSYFKKYNPVILSNKTEPLEDFTLLMSFNRIIQSVSTFSWWASFLSNAEKIYMPEPAFGYWNEPQTEINLKVPDESRYNIIACKERYKLTMKEKIKFAKKILYEKNLNKIKIKFQYFKKKTKLKGIFK